MSLKGVRLDRRLSMLVGSSSWCVVIPSLTSEGMHAMVMNGCSIGPIISTFPDSRCRTGRTILAARVNRNSPGKGMLLCTEPASALLAPDVAAGGGYTRPRVFLAPKVCGGALCRGNG